MNCGWPHKMVAIYVSSIFFFSCELPLIRNSYFTAYVSFSFNWRIIPLQCCVGFCHTTWIHHKYTYIPFPLEPLSHPQPPSHPSRSSQSTGLSFLCYTAGSQEPFIFHMVVHLMHKHGRTCFECQSSWVNQLFPVGCDEYQSSWVDPQGVLGREKAVKGKEPG